MFGSSYSVRKIVEWFNKNNIKNYHEVESGMIEHASLVNTGLVVELGTFKRPDEDIPKKYSLSIQTHPLIAGDSFAETAFLCDSKIKYVNKYGYSGVIRHHDQEDLFRHINEMLEQIKYDNENNIDIDEEDKSFIKFEKKKSVSKKSKENNEKEKIETEKKSNQMKLNEEKKIINKINDTKDEFKEHDYDKDFPKLS